MLGYNSVYKSYISSSILEFKYGGKAPPLFGSSILVAPYWNLNEGYAGYFNLNAKILVAPYWNLNTEKDGIYKKDEIILVAPYWNLNKYIGITFLNYSNILVAPYWNLNIESRRKEI